MDSETPAEQVRRVLEAHGLPGGLLPELVQRVTFDEASGDFDVRLVREVERIIAGFRVWYATRVHGTVTSGRISRLGGVKAKRGLWVPVTAIRADADDLAFSVGPVSQALPRAAFE